MTSKHQGAVRFLKDTGKIRRSPLLCMLSPAQPSGTHWGKTMRRYGMLFCAWALLPVAGSAADVVREQPVTLQLDVNAEGQVTAARVMDPVLVVEPTNGGRSIAVEPGYVPLPPTLVHTLEQVPLKWKFQPVRMAGIPVTGRTWARAMLQFVARTDGNLDVVLRYERNGPFMQRRAAPRYPESMMRQDVTGVLAVEYVVEPDGTIDHIRVLKSFGKAAKHQAVFEQAILTAYRDSRSLPLLVDGKPVATRMRVPFVFSMNDGTSEFDKARLLRRAMQVIHLESRRADSSAPMAPGESVAIDSPFVWPAT